jgi:guanylate kinase
MEHQMQGNLFIITAPSGAGKTSLVKAMLQQDRQLSLSISHTTRAPRPGETDGCEYYFIDAASFAEKLQQQDFLESAEVHGAQYGTSKTQVYQSLQQGIDVILEIDWQGAQQIKKIYPAAISIFILPPSMHELEQRLRRRGQDSEAVIMRRLAGAKEEMRHVAEFDYVTINHIFEVALQDLLAIVRTQRLRSALQLQRQAELLQQLI